MPNGAKCQTAQDAERRQLPNDAECQTAPLVPALFGISRCLAPRAVWHLAPFGLARLLSALLLSALLLSALLLSAPFGPAPFGPAPFGPAPFGPRRLAGVGRVRADY